MRTELKEFLDAYRARARERGEAHRLPPRPLGEDEVRVVVRALEEPGLEVEDYAIFDAAERVDRLLVRLLAGEVRRGTFPASHAKARGLASFVRESPQSPYLDPGEALDMLAAMRGGAAAGELVGLLADGILADRVAGVLKDTVLVSRANFDALAGLAGEGCDAAVGVLKSWAEREFAAGWKLPDRRGGVAIRVGDNVTTGHLSPSRRADSRTDHPLHAQYIIEGREDEEDFLKRLERLREERAGERVILVAGRALGEGSSRKSATYTLLQVLGRPVEGEPERKEGGVVIAESMAPIFENSLVASGILPVRCETGPIAEGDRLDLRIGEGKLVVNGEREIAIQLPVRYKLDKVAAGGMTWFDAGNELQRWAAACCQKQGIAFDAGRLPSWSAPCGERPPQTLAQKIVAGNRLDARETILPGETAPVRIRGVYSQDTTGPMTVDEYQSMAGEDFGAGFVVQSLCHTGECPSTEDRDRHRMLDRFFTSRGGVCLEPGEGIIHTVGNRFVLPTDIIVGGDSHTRTPRGISFPAASDIVAGAMKYGKQDLTMDESVRVIFRGRPREGITARDLVSTLVVYADRGPGREVYGGRIIEMEGLEFLDEDERYMLTNAAAERSASAATVPPDAVTLGALKRDLDYLRSRPDAGGSPSVKRAIADMEDFLEHPVLPEADDDARYAATVEIPLVEVDEPLVARPHHPDNVAGISREAGSEVDEVFIGSCAGGDRGSIRAAARVVEGRRIPHGINFVVAPAARDIYRELAGDGSLAVLVDAGATVIMPGCGLCMGNKRRIGSSSTAFTTTTRNYRSRIGPADSKAYLGSAPLAAMVALLGRIPDREEYFELF